MNGNGRIGRTGPWAVLALLVALACGLWSATSALAQKGGGKEPPQPPAGWEVIFLQPPEDYYWSHAQGVSGGQQAGSFANRDGSHAGFWTGTPESCVDLHPADALDSYAYAVGDGQQVGVAYVFDGHRVDWHASLWTGTAESWVDLHPAGTEYSHASGVDDGRQVGYAGFHYNMTVASLWTGTAESWVSLHPSGWRFSSACGVCGNQVVGQANQGAGLVDGETIIDNVQHAMLWTLEPYSWVDLHPAQADTSIAYDVSDGQQVGVATVRPWGRSHAALWTGTAKSWVDLHPKGYDESYANGVSHGYQAGYALRAAADWFDGNILHAGMWSGNRNSWVNLHALLPADYTSSVAEDIEVTDTDICVVGRAYSSYQPRVGFWRVDAVLWHKSLSP